jgi:MFS family permease
MTYTRAERGTILTVGLGEVLVRLGFVPVTAVVPALAAELGVGAAEASWILTPFILTLAGSLLVAGRLGDLLGHQRLFLLGAVIFMATAAMTIVVTDLTTLVIVRAVQGVGAALVSGNNLAILVRAIPPERRGGAMGIIITGTSLVSLTAAAVAPALVATGYWQLIFLAALPVALWAVARSRRLPDARPVLARAPVDWTGAGLLVFAMTAVAVLLNHPHTESTEPLMPLFHAGGSALAMVAVAGFVLVERRVAVPLLDWRWLREPVFAAAVIVNFLIHMAMMATMFLGPVLVVSGLGLGNTAGSMIMVTSQGAAMLTAFVGGSLYDRTGAAWLRPLSFVGVAAGFVGWAFVGLQGSYAGILAVGVFAGFWMGALIAVNNTVIMGSLPAEARGVASGMLETTRHFGHALGVTVATAILALFVTDRAPAALPLAYSSGFAWACVVMAVLSAVGALMSWVSRPPRRLGGPLRDVTTIPSGT